VVERVPNPDRYRQGATVSIRTKDKRFHSSTVYEPKGSAAIGVSWDDIDDKYRTLMPEGGLGQREIEESLVIVKDLRRVTDLDWLIGLLRPQAKP